jgi:hypothetical protein
MMCKLCGYERPLVRSHPMPEFLYSAAYDEKHRAVAPDKKRGREPFIRKGYREPLLCEECEQAFSRLEREFSQLWYHRKTLPSKIPEPYIKLEGLPYHEFKLFHLSILWRAGIARSSPFSQVTLGPYESQLRQMLLSKEWTPEERFPVFACLLVYPDTRGVFHPMVIPPTSDRIDGIRTYCTVFGGCAWYYPVSSHGTPFSKSLMLTEVGTMLLPVICYTEFGPLRNFVAAWKRAKGRRMAGGAYPPARHDM